MVHSLLAPSILSADFSKLSDQVLEIQKEGANWVHVDVMDGHFVPNITIGPCIVKALRPITQMTLDCHLMVSEPEKWVEPFAKAGADIITVHAEVSKNIPELMMAIKEAGCQAGISINPSTPVSTIADHLDYFDLVLIMSVHPGFSGQKFKEGTYDKLKEIAKLRGDRSFIIEVDGGVNAENIGKLKMAGADAFVAGSAVFSGDIKTSIKKLRDGLASVDT